MTITVRLDSATVAQLKRLARRKGLTKSELVREGLRLLEEREPGDREGERLYDAIAPWIGCARGGPPELSTRTGLGFRRLLRSRKARR